MNQTSYRNCVEQLFSLDRISIPNQLVEKLEQSLYALIGTSKGVYDAYISLSRMDNDLKTSADVCVFLRYEIIQRMFHDDFLKKEVKETIDKRYLSNASIMHICLQIISQLESEVFSKISISVQNDDVWNQIKQEIEEENTDLPYKDIIQITNKRFESYELCDIFKKLSIDSCYIKEKTMGKIQIMKENLVFDMFDIYICVYNINQLLNKDDARARLGNILLYNKSYKKDELNMLPKAQKQIFSTRVTVSSKEKDALITDRGRVNTVCNNNKTKLWQLYSAVTLHCEEQVKYLSRYKFEWNRIVDNVNELIDSIDKLGDRMNRMAKN